MVSGATAPSQIPRRLPRDAREQEVRYVGAPCIVHGQGKRAAKGVARTIQGSDAHFLDQYRGRAIRCIRPVGAGRDDPSSGQGVYLNALPGGRIAATGQPGLFMNLRVKGKVGG